MCVCVCGFKKKMGTEMCVFTLKEIIRYYNLQNSHIFVCFMDASAAFDRISYYSLFHKLLKRLVPLYLVRILFYWYFNQLVCVRWNQEQSYFFTVSNGVRQGGILSPLLYNVYMNDLSNNLNNLPVGCVIQKTLINHLMYAGDVVLFAPSVKGLQRLVNTCHLYGEDHNIKFNTLKTVCMHIKPRSSKWLGEVPRITLGNTILKNVTEFTYLGHIVTNDLSDDADILKHVRSLYCKANTLIRKFSNYTDAIRSFLFQMYCGNLYCSSLWCFFKKSSLKKLSVAYNNAFRILQHLPRWCSAGTMFVTRNVQNFNSLLRKNVYSLRSRVQCSNNVYVSVIYESDIKYKSALFKRIEMLLSNNIVV